MAPHEGAPTQLSTLHDNSFRFSFFLLLLSTLPQALSLRFIFSFSSFFPAPNSPFLSLFLSVFFFFHKLSFFSLPPDFLIRRWCSTTEAAQWRSGISHLVREALICIKGNPMNTRENMFDSIRESLFYYCNIR